MSLIRGKQIAPSSVGLDRLSPSTGLTTLLDATATLGTSKTTFTNDTDLVNKMYVDSVASGLNVKKSVRVISLSNITLSGTQTIDGVSVNVGDRVLVAGQTTATFNGIYNVATASWTRSTDADNINSASASEVTSGMFSFVSEGTSYMSTGWVLSTPNPITLGTTPLSFVQFSSAGVLIKSNGIDITGNLISVSDDNLGLTFSAGKLSISLDGSTISKSALGLRIDASYPGQTSITTLGTITSGTWSATTIDTTKGGTGLTSYAIGDTLYSSAPNTLSKLTIGTAGQVLTVTGGVPTWVTPSGDISSVVAGAGLTGGGIVGDITLDILSGNGAIVVNADTIDFTLGTGNDTSLTIQSSGAVLNRTTLGTNLVGTSASTSLSSAVGVVTVLVDGASVKRTAGGLLKSSTPVVSNKYMVANTTTADFQAATATTLSSTPANGSFVRVYVNGLSQSLGDGVKTKESYFSSDGGTTAKTYATIASGDTLYWVGSVATFQLSAATDTIDFDYVS